MLQSISLQAAVLPSHLIGKVSDTNVPCNLGLCRLRYCVRSAKPGVKTHDMAKGLPGTKQPGRAPAACSSLCDWYHQPGWRDEESLSWDSGSVLACVAGLNCALSLLFLREVQNAEDLRAEYFVLASTRAGDLLDGALQCPVVLLLVPAQGFPTLVAIGSRLR